MVKKGKVGMDLGKILLGNKLESDFFFLLNYKWGMKLPIYTTGCILYNVMLPYVSTLHLKMFNILKEIKGNHFISLWE
jgi:hypothetical protein